MATCGAYQDIKVHDGLWVPSVSQAPVTHFKVHACILGLLTSSSTLPLAHRLPSPQPFALPISHYSHYSLCHTLSLSSSHCPLTLSLCLLFPLTLSISLFSLFSGCYSPSPTDSPGHDKSAGHIQSSSSLCPGLRQVGLSVLSFVSTTKPLTRSWSSWSCQQFLSVPTGIQ